MDERKASGRFCAVEKTFGSNAHHILRWHFATGERSDSLGDDAQSGFGWHIECSAMSRKHFGNFNSRYSHRRRDNIFPITNAKSPRASVPAHIRSHVTGFPQAQNRGNCIREASQKAKKGQMSKSLQRVGIDDVLGRIRPDGPALCPVICTLSYPPQFNWKEWTMAEGSS